MTCRLVKSYFSEEREAKTNTIVCEGIKFIPALATDK